MNAWFKWAVKVDLGIGNMFGPILASKSHNNFNLRNKIIKNKIVVPQIFIFLQE